MHKERRARSNEQFSPIRVVEANLVATLSTSDVATIEGFDGVQRVRVIRDGPMSRVLINVTLDQQDTTEIHGALSRHGHVDITVRTPNLEEAYLSLLR